MRRPRLLHLSAALCAACCLLLFSQFSFARSKSSDAVLLSSIKALTFRAGSPTTSRRVAAIPQLNCVGGGACNHYEPDTIRCTNSGSSYSSSDVEWTCQASLPPEFKLGSTDVVCEGYDSPRDDYILKGSCGLEYRLLLTDLGEEKFGRGWFRKTDRQSRPSSEGISATLFWLAFIGVAAWMVYAAFIRDRRGGGPARRAGAGGGWFGGGGGGGGGGPDDWHDPPPPYTPRKPRPSASTYGARGGQGWFGGMGGGQRGGWQPGFWTGLGTGAAATHLAGRAFGGRQRQEPYGGRWGGGGGGSNYAGESSSMGRRGGGWGSSSPAPSFSSERHTSTGFGGTRRR